MQYVIIHNIRPAFRFCFTRNAHVIYVGSLRSIAYTRATYNETPHAKIRPTHTRFPLPPHQVDLGYGVTIFPKNQGHDINVFMNIAPPLPSRLPSRVSRLPRLYYIFKGRHFRGLSLSWWFFVFHANTSPRNKYFVKGLKVAGSLSFHH